MPLVAKNKKVYTNTEIENPSVDFDTFHFPEEVSIHRTRVMNLNEILDFS